MLRAYNTLFPGADRDASLIEGLRWAFVNRLDQTQGPTLWLPDHDELRELPKTMALVKAGLPLFADRPGHRGHARIPRGCGSVVAFCQRLERLIELEPADDAVVLVGAHSSNIDPNGAIWRDIPFHQPWVDAFDPAHLSGPKIARRIPLHEAPVVRAALETFTATTFGGTTMHRSSDDGGRVVNGLLQLHEAGYDLHPDELLAAALERGWKGREALILREHAEAIASGMKKRPAVKYPEGQVDRWQSEAADDTGSHRPALKRNRPIQLGGSDPSA